MAVVADDVAAVAVVAQTDSDAVVWFGSVVVVVVVVVVGPLVAAAVVEHMASAEDTLYECTLNPGSMVTAADRSALDKAAAHNYRVVKMPIPSGPR